MPNPLPPSLGGVQQLSGRIPTSPLSILLTRLLLRRSIKSSLQPSTEGVVPRLPGYAGYNAKKGF